MRVFGSRARGCARIDSDLDVAITASDGNYTRFDAEWKQQLSEETGLKAAVSQYNRAGDDTIKGYCDECSILVFERPSSSGLNRPGRR